MRIFTVLLLALLVCLLVIPVNAAVYVWPANYYSTGSSGQSLSYSSNPLLGYDITGGSPIVFNYGSTAWRYGYHSLPTIPGNFGFSSYGSSNGTFTVATGHTGEALCFYDNGAQSSYLYRCWRITGDGITAAFSGTNLTGGYPPNLVAFTDSSTGSPTSWNWSFGDGTFSNLQNPTHYYNTSGSFSVSLNASKTNFADFENKTNYVTVNSLVAPSCSFTVNQYSGNSPLLLNFNDTSSGSPPLSQIWRFDMDDLPWITVTPSETNFTSSSPTVLYSGSGLARVYHTVTNSLGTSQCGIISINISGVAPTPTPTPDIPFPNQTGICQYTRISLGSQWVSPYQSYMTLSTPSGKTLNDYYVIGQTRLTQGTYYTSEIGQYIYNEYNQSNQLEYRSSYVVSDCSEPNVTQTTITIVPTITQHQTYPTVTGTVNPSVSPTNIPTIQPIQTIPPVIPVNIPPAINATNLKQKLAEISAATLYFTDIVDDVFATMNNYLMYPVTLALSPIVTVVNTINYALQLWLSYFNAFTQPLGFMYEVMTRVLSNIHWKVKFVITFGLICDLLIQVYNLKRGRWR